MGSSSDDLVESLRARLEAADEIERLRAEVAEHAVQLEQVVNRRLPRPTPLRFCFTCAEEAAWAPADSIPLPENVYGHELANVDACVSRYSLPDPRHILRWPRQAQPRSRRTCHLSVCRG